ncbi:MAG: glycosyltransferase family 1 protein [Candidatus Uhrbacteria bacterium]
MARPNQSGVGEYTLELLRALFEIDSKNDYLLLSTGTETARRQVLDNLNKIDIEQYRSRVRHLHYPIRNKQINLGIFTRSKPCLDDLLDTDCDIFWFPNLNFIATQKTPSVITIHDLSFKIFPQFFDRKTQIWHQTIKPEQTLKSAQTIIAPSESTRSDTIKLFGLDPEKIKVIPHGVNHQFFKPKMLPQDHGIRSQYRLPENYILFMGTIEPRKNLHALLDAISENSKLKTHNSQLVISGSPGWRSQDILDRFKQMPNVHYLGYIPQEHRPALYRAAQAFVFPSIYEGFGLPVLEAMACGTPVITSHSSSLPEITGDAALLINPYNANDIAIALDELTQSDNLRQNLIQAGLEQASHFTWHKAAEQTLDILTSKP